MNFEFLGRVTRKRRGVPQRRVKTGFASQPAEHIELTIDFNEVIAPNGMTAYCFRASGPPSQGRYPIFDGAQVITNMDRPLTEGCLVLADDGGEFVLRRLRFEDGQGWLIADDPTLPPLRVTQGMWLIGVAEKLIIDIENPPLGGGQ